ncbi:hypothetical protein LXL04_001934 [Taraxacum kok-saghyz]
MVERLIQKDYKMVNMDQWTNFFRFCQEIEFPELKNYDACQAWSLILDNFRVDVEMLVQIRTIIEFENGGTNLDGEESNDWHQDFSGINKISEDQKRLLEAPFLESEIKVAVGMCGRNKSSGPDGFSIEFVKKFWHVFNPDIVQAFNDFNDNPKIPKGCNSAFITLVPKVLNPSDYNHFRPISLIGIIYKILSKTLANRLKNILPSIINEVQSAFVKNRQILDGPMIINQDKYCQSIRHSLVGLPG